jgi:hypothetical protein
MEHSPSSPSHNELIIDQFIKQALPFANMVAYSHEDTFKLLFTLREARKGYSFRCCLWSWIISL